MITFTYKLFIVLIALGLAVSPFSKAFSACQQLGEYCGSPPTETFPACCPFDTSDSGKQVPLKCKNVDNGVGTCEVVEDSDSGTKE